MKIQIETRQSSTIEIETPAYYEGLGYYSMLTDEGYISVAETLIIFSKHNNHNKDEISRIVRGRVITEDQFFTALSEARQKLESLIPQTV